jgi:type IV fimbrial biogenesis protein FimT
MSLIELMVTIAVLVILLGLAIPSFQSFIRNNRLTTVANELASAFSIARSEAVRRGQQVTVCKADTYADIPACGGDADWNNGWLISVGGATFKIFQINGEGVEIEEESDASTAVFLANGSSNTGLLSFTVKSTCEAGDGNSKRVVEIAPAGRVSVKSEDC